MGKTKSIIHIGAPKTGSSSIQKFLEVNKNLLNTKFEVALPSNLGNNHEELSFASYENSSPSGQWDVASSHVAARYFENNLDETTWKNYLSSTVESLSLQIKHRPSHLWLFTCEGLYDRLMPEDIERFTKILDYLNLDAKILVYVRNPFDAALSRWGTDLHFDGVFTKDFQMPNPDRSNLSNVDLKYSPPYRVKNWFQPEDFYNRLNVWQYYFPNKVTVRNFDSNKQGFNLYKDFLSFLDISNEVAFEFPSHQNVSMSAQSLEVVNRINQTHGALLPNRLPDLIRYKYIADLVRLTWHLPRYVPSRQERQSYKDFFSESYTKLHETYFQSKKPIWFNIFQHMKNN